MRAKIGFGLRAHLGDDFELKFTRAPHRCKNESSGVNKFPGCSGGFERTESLAGLQILFFFFFFSVKYKKVSVCLLVFVFSFQKEGEVGKERKEKPPVGLCVARTADLLISFEKVFVLQPLGNEIVAAQSNRGASEIPGSAKGSEETTPPAAPPKKKKKK